MSIPNNAGTVARGSAELQNSLAGISLPAIKEALAAFSADLGRPGEEPASIRRAYGDVRAGLQSDYEDNRARSTAYLKQQAKQSGTNFNPAAMSEATTSLTNSLQASEAQQLRALNFQESQAGLNQTNSLLSNITGTSGNILGGAFRFGGNALQSDQVLQQYRQQGQQAGATYGAAAGTILGGLIAGALSYGTLTGVGAAAGGALGGAAGGYFGGSGY